MQDVRVPPGNFELQQIIQIIHIMHILQIRDLFASKDLDTDVGINGLSEVYPEHRYQQRKDEAHRYHKHTESMASHDRSTMAPASLHAANVPWT